uniref:RxLR effector candidate protein n=1 Tax=Hyaloperonospora arabidopsidis (strain Emoy2) TaxID=559515 RepID=M4BLF1_HYAAE
MTCSLVVRRQVIQSCLLMTIFAVFDTVATTSCKYVVVALCASTFQQRGNGIPESASQWVTGCTVFSSMKRKFVPEGDVPMETVMYRAAEATRVGCRELGLFGGSAHPKLGDHRFICTEDVQRGQSVSFCAPEATNETCISYFYGRQVRSAHR